uniref:Large ribosomal subunit protein bL9c n=1 Tax=Hydropuntia rangiferina TaxID=338881 RepID=A0A345U8N2_9FLOR|nr:ribosomal protein L9 [Hydropuntia rangiferina]AXI96818.1 ribosomal protein L9 [Hydropuntia rangiferina]UAD87498.1 ribosomal protein L9 [Hydropuntia rangiferina]
MKKKISVILKKDLIYLGLRDSIVNVSSGYAFNYLIPYNFAYLATNKTLKHHKMFADAKQKKLDQINTRLQLINQKLNKINKFSIKKKVGKNNQIFGSVSDKDIISYLFYLTEEKLDKKNLSIPDIKTSGVYDLNINILNNIIISIKLQILPLFI